MTAMPVEPGTTWRDHIIDSWDGIRRVIAGTRRIAVLGIKLGDHRPAYFVPEYAQRVGFDIVPVPVAEFAVTFDTASEKLTRPAAVPGSY